MAGLEPASSKAADFKSAMVTNFITLACAGPAYRNRTHIKGVEIPCIIHYTNARIWCLPRDSNPEPTDYESAALTIELERQYQYYTRK